MRKASVETEDQEKTQGPDADRAGRKPLRARSLACLAWWTCKCAVLLLARGAWCQTPELIVLKETGPRDKRVNIVILGDGYTAAERSKFLTHLQTVSDAVVKDYPLWDYMDFFNVYGIFVASNQSGADNPAQGITRDTYFGAAYDASLTRLLTIDDAKGFSVINQLVPESDMQFAVVNSDAYGGSGGQIAVANYSSPEIIAHEAQHSFTGLGDEYSDPGIQPWEAPNTTAHNTRATVRWSPWIAAATPVPTPATAAYAQTVGLFEGAAYNPIGWYRPKENCRMRQNNQPFCEVCQEAIVLAMYKRVSPLDSAWPAGGSVAGASNQPVRLRVQAKHPLFHALEISWSVDGVTQSDQRDSAFSKLLAAGNHRVLARIRDTTHMVRTDTAGLLADSAQWSVSITAVTGLGGQAGGAEAGTGGDPDWRADAAGITVRWKGGGSARLRLRLIAADGSVAEQGDLDFTAGGESRRAWNRRLQPGWYSAELSIGSKVFRQSFSVPQ